MYVAEYNRCLAQSVNQLGNTTSTECGTTTGDNTGCTVVSSSDASYGAGFAAAGGGVYVCEFAADGIRVWFFLVRVPLTRLPIRLFLFEIHCHSTSDINRPKPDTD